MYMYILANSSALLAQWAERGYFYFYSGNIEVAGSKPAQGVTAWFLSRERAEMGVLGTHRISLGLIASS